MKYEYWKYFDESIPDNMVTEAYVAQLINHAVCTFFWQDCDPISWVQEVVYSFNAQSLVTLDIISGAIETIKNGIYWRDEYNRRTEEAVNTLWLFSLTPAGITKYGNYSAPNTYIVRAKDRETVAKLVSAASYDYIPSDITAEFVNITQLTETGPEQVFF